MDRTLVGEVEHQIGRLDISMNDLFFLGGPEGSGHLAGHVEGERHVKLAMPLDVKIKRLTFDNFGRTNNTVLRIDGNNAGTHVVSVGKDATIGAGSTIGSDAPAGELTVSRARQTTIKGWKRPTKKE